MFRVDRTKDRHLLQAEATEKLTSSSKAPHACGEGVYLDSPAVPTNTYNSRACRGSNPGLQRHRQGTVSKAPPKKNCFLHVGSEPGLGARVADEHAAPRWCRANFAEEPAAKELCRHGSCHGHVAISSVLFWSKPISSVLCWSSP